MTPMPQTSIRHKAPHSLAPRNQKGLGMLEVLLFIAILSGLAVTGYLEWRARETVKTAREERQSLSQADTALITFSTVNFRLPCPDTNRDGLEDCGGAPYPKEQKGWLPSTTLQLAGADPGVAIGQLRYLVQRGAAAYDLANPTVADDWRPLEYSATAPATFNAMRDTVGNGGTYQANILTLADLCQRVGVGAGTALTSGMAQVSSSPARTVAYALAHPGITDSDGNGSLFERANATSVGNTFEDPARAPLLSSYDDRVLERSFSSLYAAFGCQPLFQSINTVALGLDVIDQVADMRADSIDAAERAIIFASLATAITAVELSAAIIEAASDSGNAVADGVLCGASLGLAVNACAAVGIHVGAAVAAGVSSAASIATIVLNATAAAAAGDALALANSTADAATLTASCPTVDVAGPLANALTELNAAEANVITLRSQLTAKQAELAPAVNARNAAYNSWLAAVRYYGIANSTTIDYRYTDLVNAANSWQTNNQTALATAAQVDLYGQAVTTANNQVLDYDAQLADRAGTVATLEAQIAALDIQIAATPDGPIREQLRLDRSNLVGRLGLVNDPTSLQQARDRAATDLIAAQSDLAAAVAANNTAQTAIGTSRTAYQNAYYWMNDSTYGPYTIYASPPYAPSYVVCTNRTFPVACTPADGDPTPLQTHFAVVTAVRDVYGYFNGFFWDDGSVQPNDNSRFLRPQRIQREIDALQIRVNDADQRVTDARSRYNALLAQFNNPPACNITGTGVTPWSPTSAADLLLNVDSKGGTR